MTVASQFLSHELTEGPVSSAWRPGPRTALKYAASPVLCPAGGGPGKLGMDPEPSLGSRRERWTVVRSRGTITVRSDPWLGTWDRIQYGLRGEPGRVFPAGRLATCDNILDSLQDFDAACRAR